MPEAPVSRTELRRALVLNALVHPVNVLVPAAVLVAAAVFGAAWLALVAIACWVVLAGVTFFDARAAIHAAIGASRSPLAGLAGEVDALVAAMNADAARAQKIHGFLAAESLPALERRVAQEPRAPVRAALEAKLDAFTRLRKRLDDLLAEMDHVVATLQTVHAEMLAADDLEQADEQGALAGQVSDLRAKVQIMSAGLEETFAETRRRV